jgi:hypothetical protein
LFEECQRNRLETAVYGPVRTVVWQRSAGDRRPYADLTDYPHPTVDRFEVRGPHELRSIGGRAKGAAFRSHENKKRIPFRRSRLEKISAVTHKPHASLRSREDRLDTEALLQRKMPSDPVIIVFGGSWI